MANTIGFGQAAVNNTLGFGQAAKNSTLGFGDIEATSWSGETNITGTPSTPPFSNVNSFSFDGVDDYFTGVGTYSELDGQTKMTFSCWIKPTSATTSVIASIKDSGSTEQFRVVFHSSRYIIIRTHTGNGRDTRTANSSITLNVWTHISFCLDFALSSGSRGRIFINGVDATSADSMNQTSINTSGGGLRIGARDVSSLLPFTGLIDEVAIWSGTDQRANVSEIYGGGQVVDLNNLATAPQPTTWQRMGDLATWNGATWTMTDVNGSYTNRSINMVEANRTTDVPPNPFANTKSILLDGVDDEVSMPFTNTSTTGSISVWIKPTDYTTGAQIVWLYVGSGYRDLIALGQRNDGTLSFSAADGGSTRWRVETDNAVVSNGAWTHVVFSFDGSNGTIYINGSIVPQTYTITTNKSWWWDDLIPTVQRLGILRVNGYSAQQKYNGNIEEQSVFTSALSSTEVSAIYNNGLPTDLSSQSNILAWYRCGDGDTAPILTDNIGSNNGTMTNFTTFSTDVPT